MAARIHPHVHRFGPVESDGLRHCTTCDLWPDALPAEVQLYEARCTTGVRLCFAVHPATGEVRWLTPSERWPSGVQAGLFAYECLAEWGAVRLTVRPAVLWPAALRRSGPRPRPIRGRRPATPRVARPTVAPRIS